MKTGLRKPLERMPLRHTMAAQEQPAAIIRMTAQNQERIPVLLPGMLLVLFRTGLTAVGATPGTAETLEARNVEQ
jgi:hypothetical protein